MIAKVQASGRAVPKVPDLGTISRMKTAKDPVFSTPITLRTHLLARPAAVRMPARRVRAIRLGLGMSREFFARCLQVSGRTLEKWEQGTSRPTGAGAALLLLVERHPELATELALMK